MMNGRDSHTQRTRGSPARQFQGSSDLLRSLSRTVSSAQHRASTPACLLQPRTHDVVAAHHPCNDEASTSGGHHDAPPPLLQVPGQIPCPRYDAKYAFRHKDGIDFPLEPFVANQYFSYSGDFVASKRHGMGVVMCEDGTTLSGEFREGEVSGVGVHTWPDGTVYQGEMLKGEAHGAGEQYWARGGVCYRGAFQYGLMHGHGKWTRYTDEEVYVGTFIANKRHGHGSLILKGGDAYAGAFANGVFEGHGTLTTNGGQTQYAGAFRNGVAHGQGTLTTPDGIVYDGAFVEQRRRDVPRSILPTEVLVRDSTVTQYIQGGMSPPVPNAGRVEKEQALLQDAYVHVYAGTPLSIAVAQCTEVVTNPMGVTIPTPRDAALKTRGATRPSAVTPPSRGRALSIAAPPKKTMHVVDEICGKVVPSVNTCNETGRMVRLTVMRVPQGEDPFNCPKAGLQEISDVTLGVAPLFKQDATPGSVAYAIGEALSAKKSGGNGFLRATTGGRAGTGKSPGVTPSPSKPNTSRVVTAPTAPAAAPVPSAVAATAGDDLSPPSPYTNELLSTCVGGACRFSSIRLSPYLPPDDYLLVAEPTTHHVFTDSCNASEYFEVAELRVPVRVVAMDFQMQKGYIQLMTDIGSGGAGGSGVSADALLLGSMGNEANNAVGDVDGDDDDDAMEADDQGTSSFCLQSFQSNDSA